MKYPIRSVTQVNEQIRDLLDGESTLSALFVRGEISNFKTHSSGHCYFSLKDEGGSLSCVMFRREASALRIRPQNGMKVLALGRVSVYTRDGKYQLYTSHIQPDGVGDLHAAFEELKARLSAQGLFDPAHKKPIPRFPRRIALVTSPTGAAVRDMIQVLKERWPMAEVYVVPCRVQGAEAPPEIAAAIAWVNAHKCADVIITGRGGGSMEDLWCFNDEGVARAIYASEIPVISAVGHEPDVTIADYVADLRSATPSNGATLAVPDQSEQYARLSHLSQRLAKAVDRQLKSDRQALDRLGRSRMLRDPMFWVEDHRQTLDRYREGMAHGLDRTLNARRQGFARLAASLDALSPLKVLSRGYAIARSSKGIVKSVGDVSPGDGLTLRLSDGEVDCTVN